MRVITVRMSVLARPLSTDKMPAAIDREPQACGLRPGIDAAGLNRLVDDLETEGFLRFHSSGGSAS